MNLLLDEDGVGLSTGRITGLLGRNGCGKSRLMRKAFARHPGRGYGGHRLRYLPQNRWVPGGLTLKRVFEDFEVEYTGFEGRFPEFRGRQHYTLKELSGGQARLVETCLIIGSPADFALLDEPFTHLMPLQIDKVIEWLLEEKSKKGFLITDHLYHHVIAIADSVYVLADGKVHEIKDPAEINHLGYAGSGLR
jgi:ABC-type multidrug transport system ATPase subunit